MLAAVGKRCGRTFASKSLPIEAPAGVELSTGRDIGVAVDAARGDRRIGAHDRPRQRRERAVLGVFEWPVVRAFELYADGEVVYPGSSFAVGLAGMPRAQVQRDELGQAAVAPD